MIMTSLSSWSLNIFILTSLFLSLILFFPQMSSSNSLCEEDRLTVYKVIMTTYWSRTLFPKHYPDWRPKAHFSKLVGKSHNDDFKLFRLDEESPEGVRVFVETGVSDGLDELSQGEGGIYDEFRAASIPRGVGRTETEFFVDGNHSKVSLMSRLVPSPDWFIGIDSVDLCNHGNWVTSLTMQVDPLDAGTDNGLTFTAPNWPTNPKGVIAKLTTRLPNHPASSFFYTDKESLPSIASFQFIKIKEYELNQVFNNHPNDEPVETQSTSNDVIDTKIRPSITNLKMGKSSSPMIMSNSVVDYVDYFTQLEKKKMKKQKKDIQTVAENEKKKFKKTQGSMKQKNCPSSNSWCRRRLHHRTLFNW